VLGAQAGGAVTEFGFAAAQVAVDPVTAVPQKYPHMGTIVPSGSVVVVDAAVRLSVCWPKAVTAAKRRNTLTRAVAFSVALDVKSLIRIMFVASRCRSILDTQKCVLVRHPPAGVAQADGIAGSQTACLYCDSSMTNSRESTSIIISMPPGKTLFVVISRARCASAT
jgi:hypothetical protein